MRSFYYTIILTLCIPISTFGIDKPSQELGSIVLTPIIASNTSIPEYAQSLILNKLSQVVVNNGVQGYSSDGRFVITANFIELSREITPTFPSMVAIVIQPIVYIGDIIEDKLFASCELKKVKGVGKTESQAFLNAFKSINMNTEEVNDCVLKGKEKIMDYYNTKGATILNEAKMLASQGEFDSALLKLLSIPKVCSDIYTKAIDLVAVVFKNKIETEGKSLLNQAEQSWNSDQSFAGAERAASILAQIHPMSSSIEGAAILSKRIASRIREIEKREWDYQVKLIEAEQKQEQRRQDNEHAEKMALIKAAKDVGVALASRPVSYSYSYTRINWW